MYKYSIFLLCAAVPLFSNENPPVEEGSRVGSLSIQHREPGGIGYHQGYTSLDFFYVPHLADRVYGIVDMRGHVFNNGKWASNAGMGARYLPKHQKVVFGAYAYWDWREAEHASFDQLSVGMEALGTLWDVHVNGYAPIGQNKKRFDGHHYELAMWGIDTTVGYWLWQSGSFGLHGAVGGYYFGGDFDKHAGGGLVCAEVRLSDWFSLKAQVSYDNLFSWNAQGMAALNVPFGPRVQKGTLGRRLVQNPERFEIIIATTHE